MWIADYKTGLDWYSDLKEQLDGRGKCVVFECNSTGPHLGIVATGSVPGYSGRRLAFRCLAAKRKGISGLSFASQLMWHAHTVTQMS